MEKLLFFLWNDDTQNTSLEKAHTQANEVKKRSGDAGISDDSKQQRELRGLVWRRGRSSSSMTRFCTATEMASRRLPTSPARLAPPLAGSVQPFGSLLCQSLSASHSEKFYGEDLAVFRLLLLSAHFFLCISACWHQLCFHVCLRRGGGFIFLIVWLRSIPALSYVIHGASICLLAKIP